MTTTCRVNGSLGLNAICGRSRCNSDECCAEPNSCEHQSDYAGPEYETLKRIANGYLEYFPNVHLIKLMGADLIRAGKPGLEVTEAGRKVLRELGV